MGPQSQDLHPERLERQRAVVQVYQGSYDGLVNLQPEILKERVDRPVPE